MFGWMFNVNVMCFFGFDVNFLGLLGFDVNVQCLYGMLLMSENVRTQSNIDFLGFFGFFGV